MSHAQATIPQRKEKKIEKPALGEFEHQVLVAIRDLGEEAYGVRISEKLLEIYGGSLALAQVYVTLRRLEKKGYLASQMSIPTPVRGGRARRHFTMEGPGVLALEKSTAFRAALVASSTRKEANNAHVPPVGGAAPAATPAR